VSWTMLPICPCRRLNLLRSHPLLVQLNVSSGVWAETVPLVLTRTPPRSSVTTPTNTSRLTSSMTPRRQAVSQFPTCVLVTTRSRALTTSTRLTSLHVTTHLTL